jgi:hypothetical protein
MNSSWPRSYEVEKPKPFIERAQKCAARLDDQVVRVRATFGDVPVAHDLEAASRLLHEAIRRGVKGKDEEAA